jgi:hypothetical protein
MSLSRRLWIKLVVLLLCWGIGGPLRKNLLAWQGSVITWYSGRDADSEISPTAAYSEVYAICSNDFQLDSFAWLDFYCGPTYPALNDSTSDITIFPQGVVSWGGSWDVLWGFQVGSVYETAHCDDWEGVNQVLDNTYLCGVYYP